MSKQSDLPSILEDDPDIKISQEHYDMMSKAYYDEGATYGRDALWHYLKSKYGKDKAPPQRTVMRFLSRQKLHQEFGGTRSGGLSDYFVPVSPFNSMSIDLIDFNFKKSRQFSYVLVVVDNFSRKMFTTPITSKRAEIAAEGMKKIFEKISKAHGEETIKKIAYIQSDDGSEWKSVFDELLKEKGIKRRRTLGAHPEQNAICERANGKVKMLLAKQIKINGGSWADHLNSCTEAYNNQYIRTTKYTPNEALQLPKEEWGTLIENVKSGHTFDVAVRKDIYEVGDTVRLKLNKSTLGKSSTPSWSEKLFKIGRVIKSDNPVIADKYKIEGMAQDQTYSRNDLQKVNGVVEEIPKKLTQRQKEQIASQLRLNLDSTVEGAFNITELEEDKREFDKDYPNEFAAGAEKMENQLEKLKKQSNEANKGPKVKPLPREKSQRQRKQVETLDPSLLKSDTQIRAATQTAAPAKKAAKEQTYDIEYIIDEDPNTSGKNKRYLAKWVGYAEPAYADEWNKVGRDKRGRLKYERNIPKFMIEAYEEAKEAETLSPTTPVKKTVALSTQTPPERRITQNITTPVRRR